MLDVATIRQFRGLLLAWRNRPAWLREAPGYVVAKNTGRRYSRYSRVMLPTFGPLYGKDAYHSLAGRCRWCRQPLNQKGRRAWHEDCVTAYWAATGNQSALVGRLWSQYLCAHDDYPPCVQCLTNQGRELDHRDALSVTWASGDDRRLVRALTLDNLQWLCHECHAAKTGDDRRRMRNLLEGWPEEYVKPVAPQEAHLSSNMAMLPGFGSP